MADHITLDAGSGGATIAADDIGGVHYQLIKLGYGALDSFTIVTASAGLPVAQQGTWTVTGAGGTFPVTDSGGSLTVDAPVGTPVFVRLSDGSSPISTLPVSAASLPLPTGAATEAKQPALGTAGTASTDVLTVQGIASMTALKVDGSAVTQPVSGTFYQATQPVSIAATVTVTGAGGTFPVTDNSGSLTVDAPVGTPVFVRLSDGAAAITTLPVSMAAVPTGASTAAKQPALGTAGTASADVITVQGIASMTALKVDGSAVTQPVSIGSTITVTGTGGSFPVTDSGGSLTVDNNGTFAVQIDGSALTALQLIDDVVQTEDVAHSTGDKGVMALAVRRNSPTSSSDADGDYSAISVDSAGRLYVNVNNVPAVSQSGAWSVAQSGTWNITTVSELTSLNGQPISMGTGTRDAGTQRVTIATNDTVAVSQSGTWNIGTATTVTTVSTVTTLANGQTAHDSAISGSPLRIGARAETALSGITLVADGDATDLYAGVDGVLITRPHCNLEDVVQERTTNTDGASTAFASGLAAPGAGVRLWIKNVTICNSSSSFCTVDLRDGSGGSVLWTLPVPATGGVTHNFDPPLRLSANTALAFDASAATTTLSISANGFKSKV